MKERNEEGNKKKEKDKERKHDRTVMRSANDVERDIITVLILRTCHVPYVSCYCEAGNK